MQFFSQIQNKKLPKIRKSIKQSDSQYNFKIPAKYFLLCYKKKKNNRNTGYLWKILVKF